MSIRLGDIAPDFEQDSSEGRIRFHDWLGDSWGVLFSHPADFTPVCTTELGFTAKLKDDFAQRGVKVIALSVDPVDSHLKWIDDINETQNTRVNFPIIADADRKVSGLYDLIHPNANDTLTVRSLFIIDPNKKVRLIITYPASTGRNFHEILRVIDSLQLTDQHKVATPANWQDGDEVVIVPSLKDEDEIKTLERAIAITDQGLRRVLATLEPGRMEYQQQAEFEYEIRMRGAERVSFPTIAGSGINGCMLHYGTNHCKLEDGKLLLLDLGARVEGYCADITRTYPISGKYSPRQKEIYDIVLRANRAVAEAARPGVTLRELNDLCKKVLAEGMIAIGKIQSAEEIGRYYMHGVSHHLGLDTHDCAVREDLGLRAGMVISDEPGLYIDEEEIGIRIEDDLLITDTGCRVLSEAIPRTTEEIEALMAR